MNTATIGRPSEYSDDLARQICDGLARGWSLVKTCKTIGTVSPAAVYKWMSVKPAFVEMYTRAKEDAADLLAEQIIDLSDQALPEDEHGRIDPGKVQQMRLQVEARKWVAAKLKPKKYGDKITQEHSGPNGQPIQVMTGVPTAPLIADAQQVEALPQPMLLDVPAISHDTTGDSDGE